MISPMNCPACGRALTPVDVSGLTIEVCQGGCAGIWVDRAELRALERPATKAGEALIAMAGKPAVTVNMTERRSCPRCPDSVLMRHFYSPRRAIAVDECATCGGTWLDGGELEQIRAEYESGGDRRQAVNLLVEEILAGDRMTLMRKQLGEELPYDSSRSRIVSSLLVAVYLVAAYGLGGGAAVLKVVRWAAIPWACVCFPHILGGSFSPVLGKSRKVPRSFVWFFGWLVLLLPFIQLAIIWAETRG